MGQIVDPGALDQIVTFRTVTKARGVGGTLSETISDFDARARVRDVRAREALKGDDIKYTRKIQVILRRRTDLSTHMRLLWQSDIFEITEIQSGSARDLYMTLYAEIV